MSQHRQLDRIAEFLISHAARCAPGTLSERLHEEWSADLQSRTSALSRLRFAIGCCWATRVIAYEHQPVLASVTASADVSRAFISAFQFRRFSRRSSTFILVLSLHLAVFYLAFSTLSHTFAPQAPANFTAVPIVDQPRPPDAPPLPTPDITKTRFTTPDLPPVRIEEEPHDPPSKLPDGAVIEGDTVRQPAGSGESVPSRTVKFAAGGPGAGFPDTDEYYPSLSRSLGEEGLATTQVCVNARGGLTREPAVTSSTGYKRLDEAALKLAKAGSGHYRANSEDGRAIDSCFSFRIRFQLRK
jgi:TonB family protein